MWTFRLRIRLDPSSRLQIENPEYTFSDLPDIGTVVLSSEEKGAPLSSADWLLFKGVAPSQEAAWARGAQLADSLRRTFARMGIAAEMGKEPSGFVTDAGRAMLEEDAGCRILDNVHGLMAYETDMTVRFFQLGEGRLVAGYASSRFEQTLEAASRLAPGLSQRERLAFDLFSGYRFENSPAARLLTLTMAVEALLIPPRRSERASELVEQLIATARENQSVDARERASLIGSLGWLRNESITTSGSLLMNERLAGRAYGGTFSAEQIWKKAYELRSDLAHGQAADRSEINWIAGLMFQVVGDLLSGNILSFEAIQALRPSTPTAVGDAARLHGRSDAHDE